MFKTSFALIGGAGVAALASLSIAATSGAAVPSSGGAALTPSAVSECGVGALTARIVEGSPGAGQRYATLTLTNRSHHTCRTGGYVGLGLENADGRPVDTRVSRIERDEVRTVILAPRASAATQLHWAAVEGTGDRPGGPCFRAPSSVLVTPPNAFRSLQLPWRGGIVCEAGSIDVTPLVQVR